MSEISGTKRIEWLDVARSLAIVSVKLNHAVNRSFAVYSGQLAEFQQIPVMLSVFTAVICAFSRLGVPVFLMISGTLLLDRDYDAERTKHFLRHNWLELLITTEIWLAIMYWYLQIFPGSVLRVRGLGIAIRDFVMNQLFINTISMGSMWYMFMILCVYLMIPILAAALKKLDHRYFAIPMAIVAFCSFVLTDVNGALAALGDTRKLSSAFSSGHLFSMYVVYLLLGYFISHCGLLERFRTWVLSVLCLVFFAAFCGFQFWAFSREYDLVVAEGYKSVFPLLTSVCLFELLRRCRIGEFGKRITRALSEISFGIYFVHICIMEGLHLLNGHSWHLQNLPEFLVLELGVVFRIGPDDQYLPKI